MHFANVALSLQHKIDRFFFFHFVFIHRTMRISKWRKSVCENGDVCSVYETISTDLTSHKFFSFKDQLISFGASFGLEFMQIMLFVSMKDDIKPPHHKTFRNCSKLGNSLLPTRLPPIPSANLCECGVENSMRNVYLS